MNTEMIRALEDLEKEKKIDREIIFVAIEEALESSYKKSYDSNENVEVVVNRETGDVKVYAYMTVTAEPKDSTTEMSLEQARKYGDKNEGDVIKIEITPKNFGRSAAQKAKQVIVQKIKEEERNIIYNEFASQEQDIVSGTIQRIEYGANNSKMIFIDLGKIEALLAPHEQVPTETYNIGDRIKAYVLEVKKTNKDPRVYVSRTHPGLVKRLFELEIAEIRQGFVEIKSISREAGYRTKIAVSSIDEKIDPVGACVGQKGQRVQNIVDELKGEKIDIIKWSSSIEEFIASSLSPSKVSRVEVDEDEKCATVVVPDNQLSLAIGKEGQNVRLAAKLTGWKIDIKNESQLRSMLETDLFNMDANDGEEETYDQLSDLFLDTPVDLDEAEEINEVETEDFNDDETEDIEEVEEDNIEEVDIEE